MESVLYLFYIQRSSFSQTASLMETYEKRSEEFRLPKWQKPTHHGLKKPVAPILTWYEFRFQQLGATVLRNVSIKIYFCRVKHFIHPKFVESSTHTSRFRSTRPTSRYPPLAAQWRPLPPKRSRTSTSNLKASPYQPAPTLSRWGFPTNPRLGWDRFP